MKFAIVEMNCQFLDSGEEVLHSESVPSCQPSEGTSLHRMQKVGSVNLLPAWLNLQMMI